MTGSDKRESLTSPQKLLRWLWPVLLVSILLAGAYFRLTGVDWDQGQHLHPDERFLTMVEASLDPVKTVDAYFNTKTSTLNPHNRGYSFFVYGTLPLFVVRYAGEWLGQSDYDQIHFIGRQISALMDLGVVLLVFMTAYRLYRSRALALLAAGFAAFSVLPIQLSHYFTVDTFTNFFGMLAVYCAVWLLPPAENGAVRQAGGDDPQPPGWTSGWRTAVPFALFGAFLGMAAASKINAVFLAALLPSAVLIRLFAMNPSNRLQWAGIYLRNLVVAAAVSVIFFRIFQPYAFTGPDFLDFSLNPKWLANMRELAAQSAGDVDFPPALQWARRPVWFSLQNMVLWGIGLPLGLLAWAGFFWMGFRMMKGEWRRHLLLWSWTGLYFVYQSINLTRTMRYQMLIYPTLAIIAAWAVWALWQRGRSAQHGRQGLGLGRWASPAAIIVGVLVLALAAAWAFAFTRVYTRPVTRVEASRWIYQNIPGPINLTINTGQQTVHQPVGFQSGYVLRSESQPFVMAFRSNQSGELVDISFEHLGSREPESELNVLNVAIADSPDLEGKLVADQLVEVFSIQKDPRGDSFLLSFSRPISLVSSKTYYLILSLSGNQQSLSVSGAVTIGVDGELGYQRQVLNEPVQAIPPGESHLITFKAAQTGSISEVVLNRVVDMQGRFEPKNLRVSLELPRGEGILGSVQVLSPFLPKTDQRGEQVIFQFLEPVEVEKNQTYSIRLEHVDGSGAIAVYGSKMANETVWDDPLPLPVDGFTTYDYGLGVFRSDLNFDMYLDDSPAKRERFLSVLDQADVLIISSNRQWGTTPRVPERYPLTSEYYRALLGCPENQDILWCYSVAEPGMFSGRLGFELAAVFQSDPNLGDLRINTQFAEEAFTVYDHPKVFIFRKAPAYDNASVQALLQSVDLSTVVHLTPGKASSVPGDLMLPEDLLKQQRQGGTWSELFDTNGLINRYPLLAVIAWYLLISLIGWVTYPFTRLALRGLPDQGYPLARMVGMLVLSYSVWLLGSAGVPFTRLTITLVFLVLVGANLLLAFRDRRTLVAGLRERWKSLLTVELLVLSFFLIFLFVRIGNPDLWHPWKGGEKPMDFSYFNAVLKSTVFPPYDPWFAGGYINYYYYGFVIVGVPVKWLGIVPALAYNLILPTLFALLAIGGFSVGSNLVASTFPRGSRAATFPSFQGVDLNGRHAPFFGGLASALGLVFFGNWGTVRMIWHGLQRMANMQVPFEDASFITRINWTLQGLVRLFTEPQAGLPYGPGDWYWIPSRAIPGEPITEFPAFTFLYADLHAHMLALPITVLAVSWALSILLNRWDWKGWSHAAASFLLGGLAVGALKPTNTWDWPTYLALGVVSIVYTALRCGHIHSLWKWQSNRVWAARILNAVVGAALLVGLSTLLFQPFSAWYGQGYNAVDPWKGDHTPFWSYMTHWGVFLFVIVSWLAWESIDWMASTPVSGLNRLRRYAWLIWAGVAAVITLVVAMLVVGVKISWFALPVAAWAGILLLRPGIHEAKRAVLFLVGTALALTLFVELAVLRGDIGRMNTVFKFYLQAWTLFAVSAGAGLLWLIPGIYRSWQSGWRVVWEAALIVLVMGAAMFPLMAGRDKITDRMAAGAPHSLDGMAYMAHAQYQDAENLLDLSEDYAAIRWMQENIQGSPVIVEANVSEYRWGSRFTIYTGLPGVVGWNWHQRQQRAVTPDTWVFERVEAVGRFYNTTSPEEAEEFLRRFDVRYIIVGALERSIYEQDGLRKFESPGPWRVIYQQGQTAIYEVVQAQ